MRPATPALPMSAAQRDVLEKLSRSRTAPAREVQREGALVLAADGVANMGQCSGPCHQGQRSVV